MGQLTVSLHDISHVDYITMLGHLIFFFVAFGVAGLHPFI